MTAAVRWSPAGWRARRAALILPDLSPRLQLVRAALIALFAISFSLLLELVVASNLQQRAAQQRAYDQLRSELANGTAPIGPTDADGKPLPPGRPVAYLEIPAIHLRQVIVEGTSAASLFDGPGHRRDSPLPGQAGTSVILGRRAAFGGPFGQLDELRPGALIHVTTGQGAFDFRVIGLRRAGDPAPEPVEAGGGRLLLATAAGRPFMPSGVLRVDAELEGSAVGGARPLIASRSLPASEQMMGADTSTLWALALWLQALIAVIVAAIWAWHRWGRAQAWVVFLPPSLLVGLAASGEAARLMPNLL
jgi:LPXTG-site transpeptidase (sortase) family protein